MVSHHFFILIVQTKQWLHGQTLCPLHWTRKENFLLALSLIPKMIYRGDLHALPCSNFNLSTTPFTKTTYLSSQSCSKSTWGGFVNGGSVNTAGLTLWWRQIVVLWPLMVPQSSQSFCSKGVSHTSSQLCQQTVHQTQDERSSVAGRCCPSLETS